MSANFSGKWIITSGFAEVTSEESALLAVLRFSDDAPPYARIEAKRDNVGLFNAQVISADKETPTFSVQGGLLLRAGAEGASKSLLLSDGVTVIGLAFGPRANENNLA